MMNLQSKRPPEAMFLTDPMMAVILQPIDSRMTVIHDGKRCYGYVQFGHWGFRAFWSGDHCDDHLIGEFADRTQAVKSVVEAAQKNSFHGLTREPLTSHR
jgi:hypothetical protein